MIKGKIYVKCKRILKLNTPNNIDPLYIKQKLTELQVETY